MQQLIVNFFSPNAFATQSPKCAMGGTKNLPSCNIQTIQKRELRQVMHVRPLHPANQHKKLYENISENIKEKKIEMTC